MAKTVRAWREEEFGIQTRKDEYGGVQRITPPGEDPRPRMYTIAPSWAAAGPQGADTVCQFLDQAAVNGGRAYCDSQWRDGGGDVPWQLQPTGPTPSAGTGPSTGPGGAPYLYVEASEPNSPMKAAMLTSAPGQYFGLVFRYHMCGATMGALYVEARPMGGTGWDLIWLQDGPLQLASEEPFATAYVAFPEPVAQVRLVAVTGDSYLSDIALADLWLKHEPLPQVPLGPYLLQSPADVPTARCLAATPEALAKAECGKGKRSQWFSYDVAAGTLRHGEQCLGARRLSSGLRGGLELRPCVMWAGEEAAWACTGAKCCLQNHGALCLLLRPTATPGAPDRYASFYPAEAGKHKTEAGLSLPSRP